MHHSGVFHSGGPGMLYDIIFRVMIWLAVNGGLLPLTALAG